MSQFFWRREGEYTPYDGIVQTMPKGCVFASVAGVVNHLVGRRIWNEKNLFCAWEQSGHKLGEQNLDNVAHIAIEPVNDVVESVPPKDNGGAETWNELNDQLEECLASGGIGILSMRYWQKVSLPELVPGDWHMLTIIASNRDRFQVWDTHKDRGRGFVIAKEIVDGVYCGLRVGRFPLCMKLDDQHTRLLLVRKDACG